MQSNTEAYAQWLDKKEQPSMRFTMFFHIIFRETSSILLGLSRGARLLGKGSLGLWAFR